MVARQPAVVRRRQGRDRRRRGRRHARRLQGLARRPDRDHRCERAGEPAHRPLGRPDVPWRHRQCRGPAAPGRPGDGPPAGRASVLRRCGGRARVPLGRPAGRARPRVRRRARAGDAGDVPRLLRHAADGRGDRRGTASPPSRSTAPPWRWGRSGCGSRRRPGPAPRHAPTPSSRPSASSRRAPRARTSPPLRSPRGCPSTAAAARARHDGGHARRRRSGTRGPAPPRARDDRALTRADTALGAALARDLLASGFGIPDDPALPPAASTHPGIGGRRAVAVRLARPRS